MPSTASQVKISAVRGYGAEIIFCEPNQKSREETLAKFVSRTNAEFIHPYDNYFVIAGQGTACKELIEDVGSLDFILTPVGGGGLLSGTTIATKYLSPRTQIIGVEPKGADDAFRSLRDGRIYPSIEPRTIADGLLTSLSERTFTIIKNNVKQILTVAEESIIQSMKLIYDRMKIIVEPSGAVPLAAVVEYPEVFRGGNVGLILSGGNVDLRKLSFF